MNTGDNDALSVIRKYYEKQYKPRDNQGREDCAAAAREIIKYLFKHGYRVLPINDKP